MKLGGLFALIAALLLAVGLAFADTVPTPAPVAPTATSRTAPPVDDASIPLAFLPPGSEEGDRSPSRAIFPPQTIPLRFNHRFHVKDAAGPHLACTTCHARATTSTSIADRLTPPGETCDTCHGSAHRDRSQVKPGPTAIGACAFCHVGWKEGDGNKVTPFELPRANMVFDHQKHAARNIGCAQCHGAVDEVGLATRDQMPRMRGCFTCHQMPDAAARGDAKSDCLTCHVAAFAPATRDPHDAERRGIGGRIRTVFASGAMVPPRWMNDAAHTPDWIERHKTVAGSDSTFCASCHTDDECVACHDGRVRPRSIHPNDYLSMHAIEARQATQKCTSCHREQSFCITCHQRVGVSMSGPPDVRMSSRFHPPKSIWSDLPRQPGHHAFEAERNLNACVSCHIERDCVACHGAAGIGGGFNPHRPGFASSCAAPYRRNPRPCLVCHTQGDRALEACR